MVRILVVVFSLFLVTTASSQEAEVRKTNLAGVYQGKTLFIQNSYNRERGSFCVEQILINNEPVLLNYKLSALKLDFKGYDLYTPVNITIVHADTVCSPIVINSEAILFHTIFRFSSISLSDSALAWSTKGEKGLGKFEVEKLEDGIWIKQETIEASGIYEGAEYEFLPVLDEAANQYRVKYVFPAGIRTRYLYSQEVDYDHYPEPVEFTPHSAKTRLYLSRPSRYEIYDGNSKLVLTGQGQEIDVTVLRQGQYVIYFSGKDPGTFIKE
ncbi:MAG: hypothetical protein RIM99_15485 [Cyclobacteriaceae bacterium]